MRLYLLDKLQEFHKDYPHVRLKISNHSTPQAIDADIDLPAFEALVLDNFFFSIGELFNCNGNVAEQVLALGCQLNPFVRTDQQFAVKLIFQNIHTAGDVGLVTSEHFCRVGKAFITGNIIENAVII